MTVIRAESAAIVAAIHVAEGDVVAAGAVLVETELMKMRHEIRAAAPSRVTRIHITTAKSFKAAKPSSPSPRLR